MTHVADKYISISGRTAKYGKFEFSDDLICCASFLVWAEKEYFGGTTGRDAYTAMMRLLDMDPIELRKIIKGEPT